MSYEARIERDSITQYGERVTTFVVTFPRLVLAEFNTHKMLSKSSASSRAIPVEKQLARLREDPFTPVHWGKNQKGMQAEEELTLEEIAYVKGKWLDARDSAMGHASILQERGVHKQITNRLIEAFMWHTVIVTATEWRNFFHLRDNKMAQPEIQKAAGLMSELYRASRPRLLGSDDWHLPFGQGDDDSPWNKTEQVYISAGRSARVSHLTHDGVRDPSADIKLARGLLQNGHMAPWEHPARPMTDGERLIFGKTRFFASPIKSDGALLNADWQAGETQYFLGNFNGWVQARKLIHGEQDILAFER